MDSELQKCTTEIKDSSDIEKIKKELFLLQEGLNKTMTLVNSLIEKTKLLHQADNTLAELFKVAEERIENFSDTQNNFIELCNNLTKRQEKIEKQVRGLNRSTKKPKIKIKDGIYNGRKKRR
jgi:hypothetical protein